MIGLKRNIVVLKEHDPAWLKKADGLCDSIRNIVGYLIEDVQHIGSTSIPSVPAKPILDLAIAISNDADITKLVSRLANTNYIYRGDWGDKGGHLMVLESQPEVRMAHLHIVNITDFQWKEYIKFRDTLKKNMEI